MSPAAHSIRIFAVYLLLLGAVLLVAPNLLLGLFRMAPTGEVWIRVVGMLIGFLGFYYWQAARAELRAFFAWTIPVRLSVPAFLAAFVVLDMGEPALLLFGAADAAAALWTRAALRRG